MNTLTQPLKLHVLRGVFVRGEQRYYQYLLAFLWGYPGVFAYVISFIQKFTPIGAFASWITPLVVALLVLACIKYLFRLNTATNWLILVGSCIAIWLSYTFGTNVNRSGIDRFLPQMSIALPYILVGAGINFRRDIRLLTIISYASIFITILYQFYFMNTGRELSEDMMSMAYNLLPHTVICFLSAYQRGLKMSWVFAIVGTFAIAAAGTRGALIALLVFLLVYAWLYSLRRGKNKLGVFLLIVLIVLCAYTFMTTFFEFAEELGFSTRTYDKILGNDVDDTGSGRTFMHARSIKEILNQGLFGHGVMGEQYLYLYVPGVGNKYTYPHNLILEILLQFGIPIGCVLLWGIFYLPYKAYKVNVREKRYHTAMFVVALAVPILVNLTFSFTFWTTPLFFLMLSYCSKEIHSYKIHRLSLRR